MKSLLAFSSLAVLFVKPVLSVAVWGQCGVCVLPYMGSGPFNVILLFF